MKYHRTQIITQRQRLVRRLVALDRSPSRYYPSREHRIAEAIADRLPVRLYGLSEGGQHYDHIWAESIDAALAVAVENFDADAYSHSLDDESGTTWIDIHVRDMLTEEMASTVMEIDPSEPECIEGEEHDWRSPYSVLGGLKENPGVWGHGGGIIIKTVCAHCGAYKIDDSWAQNPENGEQGLDSVEYHAPDDVSLAWLASLNDD